MQISHYAMENTKAVLNEIVECFKSGDPTNFLDGILSHEIDDVTGRETLLRVYGGPSVRVSFERDHEGNPRDAGIEVCDWWTPWQRVEVSRVEQEALNWIASLI